MLPTILSYLLTAIIYGVISFPAKLTPQMPSAGIVGVTRPSTPVTVLLLVVVATIVVVTISVTRVAASVRATVIPR